MARLIIRGEYYDSVAPGALYEDDYERLLVAHRREIYPAWHLVSFKCTVESPYGNARPDLALVDARYRRWWVVEVELSSHPLYAHVAPQVQSLATGHYDLEHAETLADEIPELDRHALREMVIAEQPRVLVIVNEGRADWLPTIHQWNGRLGIVEVFRSPRNVDVLRVDGEHPDDLGNVISFCYADPALPRSLIVSSPAALPPGARLEIAFDGGISEWARIDAGNRVWLMPVRRSPLPTVVREFQLKEDDQSKLFLVPVRRG